MPRWLFSATCLASHSRLTKVFFAHMSTKPGLRRELGLRDFTLFAVTCVISARWIPIAAHAGPGSVTLWLLAAVLFMVPLAVAVGALVAKYPGAGGLYLWTRLDFGAWSGFVCFWVYWMGTAFLFPTAALLYVKVGFSMFGPSFARLGDNRFYLLSATVAFIWIALGSNLIGLKIGKWTENIGAVATWGVGLVLVVVAWMVWMRRGAATPMHILPKWTWGTVNFWAAIIYGTSGMEAPGMMAEEIREPERTMLRAGWIASGVATVFYVSATIAFLVVLSPENISELNGSRRLEIRRACSWELGGSLRSRRYWWWRAESGSSVDSAQRRRGCHLPLAWIACCPRHSAEFIRDGERLTCRFWYWDWCRPCCS